MDIPSNLVIRGWHRIDDSNIRYVCSNLMHHDWASLNLLCWLSPFMQQNKSYIICNVHVCSNDAIQKFSTPFKPSWSFDVSDSYRVNLGDERSSSAGCCSIHGMSDMVQSNYIRPIILNNAHLKLVPDFSTHTICSVTHNWVNHHMLTWLLIHFTRPVFIIRTKLAR